MSAEGVDAAAPNLNLTPEEKRLYGQLFRQADTESVGVVTGETAVKFFEKTRLDSRVLGEIWQIADKENRGFLTPAGFGLVLRLIGHAQAGREPTTEIALQPGPLPRFDSMPPPAGLTSPTAPPAVPLQAQSTGGGPIRIPPLTPEKVSQYAGLFERQPLQAGNLLPGDAAKSIFEKSGLPTEVLGRIWQLADTEQRGALVLTEFVIAMHLLTSMKTGALRGLPNILPAALYEAATRRGPTAPRQSPTGTGPISAIPRQLSGSAQFRAGSPLGRPPITAQTTGTPASDWLITPDDKARFDVLYNDLDKTHKGFITGEEAVPFLSQSNLPEDALAQIWDLADINSEGRLNRDTFAVAMYLIRQQRMRRDGSVSLPTTVPANLIPPSMRTQARPQTSGSPFDAPPQPQPPAPAPPPAPKSALDDLFGLDTPPAPAPAQVALSTGGSNANDPFGSGSAVLTPSSPIRPSPTGTQFKPFVPSSSFGRGLTVHSTGDSNSGKPPAPSASEDLLGDGDPEVSKKLTNETAELANLSNQVGSLSKQMQEVQGQRTTTQNELNQANSQKKNFEQRLAQLRTLYEKEAKDVEALQVQLNTSRNETKKLQAECMALDGTYRDLQTQHQQVYLGLQADQAENAKLKETIRTLNAEIAKLKSQTEKLRSEARQQKGLVAINKKQSATNEGERDKLQTELSDLSKNNEELSRQANTSSPIASSAQVASPTPSTASGNNPFFRRTGSTDIMGSFGSPPPVKPSSVDKSFDDVFGPAFPPAGSSSTPPPATSFKPQHTGASTASLGSFSTPPVPTSPNVSRQATLTAEPPAPPESRQISSSFLPFADASESLSSSRAVSPPASRAEGSETPQANSLPGAFPLEVAATGQSTDSASTASNKEPAVQGDTKPSGNGVAVAPNKAAVDSDPFAAMGSNDAKADFDDAFASFTSAHKSSVGSGADANKSSSAFDSEFPPISELDREDDDSDTASEGGGFGGGFDDDFAPASPQAKKTEAPEEDKEATSPPPAPVVEDVSASEPTAAVAASSEVSETPVAPAASAAQPAAPKAKSSFDDLDDEFEGLEDAKEGSADDDFQTISRSGLDDFNPVFDSSPPPSQAKTESTAFGHESSYDFGSVSPNPAAGGNAGASAKGTGASEAQDWDAIFASLDSPSDANANPTASAPALVPPATETRPAPGRALTQSSEHDDPILKNLTSMGYSREDAILALEKYDYNLERAANYLASQS
ncbi:UBA/TS-N domain-containing protein [Colletotrichum graminicola]|uniref:UBA/TS-N domain-containing protein n=1 Tax=Colletotrichum graminicola (strain M1.001 / M2 / FGSC 10212) TaxID=645133 RepID=E3QMV0_COLGM|nr:UBA/TS-N domain-containing protein [Colletotrichum graminicola M1.001]EFQ32188.1 UBA/TS-N domain-containing protein [Colletotrichum graminicola M1.001]WDK09453.1 UBA/TS-N domain-containing protein [Colletotrichum graminicola]